MQSSLKARIVGIGSYLPEKILTNQDLEKLVDTSDEWIVSRTGMKERRIAGSQEHTSDLGTAAALKALKKANLSPKEVDLILVATMSPDYISPSTASIIQKNIQAAKAAAFDIQAACSGFLYALSVAKAYVESGMFGNVLLIAAEKMSAFMDYNDRNTCVLFGDGACAAVIAGKGAGFVIDPIILGGDGDFADYIMIPGGGSCCPASSETIANKMHFFKMNGREVYKHAIRRMEEAGKTCLEKAQISKEQLKWIIPHQANLRISEALSKKFQIPVYSTVEKYGNTSASSIGIAFNELTETEEIAEGDRFLLVTFGGGLTWGAAILKREGS